MRISRTAFSPSYGMQFPTPAPAQPERPALAAQILSAGKWTLLACTLAGLGIAIAYSLTQTPIYRAHTAIEIQKLNDNVLNSRDVDPTVGLDTSSQSYVLTQMRVLQSTPLLTLVAQKVDPPAPGQPLGPHKLTARELVSGLKVSGTEASHVLDISYDSTDPKIAASILNVLGVEFIKQDLQSRIDRSHQTSTWLNEQMDELKLRLKRSETALQEYARRSNLILAPDQSSAADARLRLLENDLERAESERIAKQAAYENVNGGDTDLATVPDPADQEYQMKLTELRRSQAELLAVFKPDYYKVKRVEAQIRELENSEAKHKTSVLHRMKDEFDSGKRREELLQKAYSQQARIVVDQGAKTVDYEVLKREVETNRQVYEAMLQKVKGFHIASAMLQSNARVIEPADVPLFPAFPNKLLNAILGLIGGLFGGLALVLLRRRTETIRQPGDTRIALHTQELGVIPSARGERKLLKSSGAFAVERLVSHAGTSVVGESFRAARASLIFASERSGSSVFLVSSLASGEGKTTVVSNLGLSLAEVGKRVILVDADQSRPRLHSIFGVTNGFGLADVLKDDRELEDIPSSAFIYKTPEEGLFILPSGHGTPGSSRLLYSSRMAALLDRLKREFEMVLVDTPPLMLLSDARVLGRLTDGVILVFQAGKTTLESAQAVHQRLSEDNISVIGTILNNWTPDDSSGAYPYSREEYADRFGHV